MLKLDRRRNQGTGIQATGIQAMRIRIRAMEIRVMRIRIRVTRIRDMGVRSTMIPGRLRRARMATTPLTHTHARPTVTMDLAGFRAESLLASGPGGAGVGTTSMGDVALGDVALAGAATMEAGGPFPDAEDIAVGSVTVTPVEADVASVVADAPSMAVDVASAAVGGPLVEADVATEEVDVPSVAVDVASVVADVPSVEGGMATVEAEAEAVPMVVDAGRFGHISKLSRPTAFAVGRFVDRHRLGLLERFWGLRITPICTLQRQARDCGDPESLQ